MFSHNQKGHRITGQARRLEEYLSYHINDMKHTSDTSANSLTVGSIGVKNNAMTEFFAYLRDTKEGLARITYLDKQDRSNAKHVIRKAKPKHKLLEAITSLNFLLLVTIPDASQEYRQLDNYEVSDGAIYLYCLCSVNCIR